MEVSQPGPLQGAEAQVQQAAGTIFAATLRASGHPQVLAGSVHPQVPAGSGHHSSHREGPGGRARAYRQGLAGPVRRNFQLRGRERVLRPDPPQPPCNRVSRAEAEAHSKVWAAAAMPG
ncbi:MAG: hypothetical protein ABSH41_32735 [Syntrophobacteraceae bacterium]